ncbi:MAG: amidohydrolase family protein, partial [Micropepsaceae bacterium]
MSAALSRHGDAQPNSDVTQSASPRDNSSGPKRKRLIVDSQVHIWKANTPERPWAKGLKPQLPEPFTIERLVSMMDEAGVDRAIIVPPRLDRLRIDYAQEAVRRYPERFAIMAPIALDDVQAPNRIANWKDQPGVLGIRLNIKPTTVGEKFAWLSDGTADWFWPAAKQADIPVMILTRGQVARLASIAERHPQLTLIIDHMGVSLHEVRNNSVAAAIEQTLSLAKYPNVSVKLSSSPRLSSELYPFRDVAPYIQHLVDAFGPQRCHWGTDITHSLAMASYAQRITQFTEELPFLSE